MIIETIEQLKEKIKQYEYIYIYLNGIKKNEDAISEEHISINSKILLGMLDAFMIPNENSSKSQNKEQINNTNEKTNQILDSAMQSIIGSVPSIEKLIMEAQKK